MTDPVLQMYLLACVLIAMAILLFWNRLRSKVKLRQLPTPDASLSYKRLKRMSRTYWIIFLAFSLMVLVYAVLPDLYFVFLPLDFFHRPLINTVGLLITKLSIAWIVVAQLNIDKELFKHSRDIESLPAMELVWYSEKMLLTGMLIFFVGIFITITNIVGLLLTAIGMGVYLKRMAYRPG